MKISKRMREEAIEAALVMADWWTLGREDGGGEFPCECDDAWDLATEAFYPVCGQGQGPAGPRPHQAWLEAASLLRDGWSPGVKISAKVREEAAVLCLIAVSAGDLWAASQYVNGDDGADCDEFHVACDAFEDVFAKLDHDDACIEAAALLRDGWNPGDPIVTWVPR